MKKYILSTVWMLCLLILSSMALTACDNNDLSTDQYGNGISLNSFGPCPVLRGGTLEFLGTNLDQITKVKIPGVDTITNITVVSKGKHSEITIQVPKDNCTPGLVSLVTVKGGVITTATPISYIENITLSKFYIGSSGTEAGSVGDSLTIEGDYLNLIHAVIFQNNIKVPDTKFGIHTRYKITVAIPKHAQTGKICLSDENASGANYLYSSDALTVNLPTCTAMSPVKPKAGATMTFTGTSLNLIQYIAFQGAKIDSTVLTISADGKTITCALPATATDGEVNLVTYSGINIPAGTITTVVPTNLALSPNPVKSGATITITGNDLDLVTGIAFNNASGTIATQSATKITAVVPTAAQVGNVTLSLVNGKTVTVAYVLVKPVIASFSPSTLIAGNDVTITGTDLDLIASIVFPGSGSPTVTAANFKSQSATSIVVTIPASANGSTISLNVNNGTTISNITGLTINPSTDPVISTAPTSTNPGNQITITGKNFTNVEDFYIGTYKVTSYSSRSDNSVTLTVPSTVPYGTYTINMVNYSSKTFTGPSITISPAEVTVTQDGGTYIDNNNTVTFPVVLAWAAGGRFAIFSNSPYDMSSWTLTAGSSVMKVYKTAANQTGQAQINDANWNQLTTAADWNGNTSVISVTMTQAMINAITSSLSSSSHVAFVIQGSGLTISKITITP